MYTKLPKAARAVLYTCLALGVGYLTLRYILPWLLPLIIALAVSAILEPAVGFLTRRARFPRGAASGICLLAFLGLTGGAVYLLCGRVVTELKGLAERLPMLFDSVSATLASLEQRASGYFGTQDEGGFALTALEAVTAKLRELPGAISGKLFELVPATAAATPSVLLFAVTAVIGAYFVSASYPELMDFVSLQIPEHLRDRARNLKNGLKQTIWRYFRAQLIMSALIFACLAAAFALLKINYALLLALVTAIIDALPVLGAGTVLLPWAAYELLTGNISTGLGLAISYIAVTVLRSCVQAKLLGDQLGLHPLATLVSIYIGYKICGVLGMIVFPILAITLSQLNDSGIIRLWKTHEKKGKGNRHDGNHFQYYSRDGDERAGSDEYSPR